MNSPVENWEAAVRVISYMYNPQPSYLYYAARGHLCKLYYQSYGPG